MAQVRFSVILGSDYKREKKKKGLTLLTFCMLATHKPKLGNKNNFQKEKRPQKVDVSVYGGGDRIV